MNGLKIFNFEENEVRTQLIDEEPWFVAKDVCDVLGISNSRQALTRLDDDEKADVILNDGSQNRNFSIVNEFGLYNLVLSSRKKEAKEFQRWVTHEVIPAIRKTGSYQIPISTDPMDALRLMFQATEQTQEKVREVDDRVIRLEEKIKLEPGEYAFIGKLISRKVYQVGQERAYSMNKLQVRELFKALNKEVAEITGVKTRTQLKQKDFEKVIDFIDDWEPSKATSLLVRAYEQIEMEV